MTPRQELIDGVRMIIREGVRTTAGFSDDDWSYQVHDEEAGWTSRQLYAHLASTAQITPGFLGALAQSSDGQNVAAGIDINALNAQGVEARAQMSPSELLDDFKQQHESVIAFIEGMPQEQLDQRRQFGRNEGPVAELVQTALILHALYHAYSAQSRPLN